MIDRVRRPRIGLGTAQFGMHYGITNKVGLLAESEIGRILVLARSAGVDVIDTAQLYDKSEEVIGRSFVRPDYWRVVTKTARLGDLKDCSSVRRQLRADLEQSLVKLNISSTYGLLVHNVDDLLGRQGDYLWEVLTQEKEKGTICKIGASVYSPRQVEALLEKFSIDLVQLPMNALDQRMLRSGLLRELKARGVEIHSRSVFLQGLLVAHPKEIDPRLGILRTKIAALQEAWVKAGLSPLEGALSAVLRHDEIDCLIVGVTSARELGQILAMYSTALQKGLAFDIEPWAIHEEHQINPTHWGQLIGGSKNC